MQRTGIEMMFEKVMMWMIFLDILGHSFSFIDSANLQSWNEAITACAERGQRLPGVTVSGQKIYIADEMLSDSKECFWLGATYERISYYSNATFPKICCGVIWKVSASLFSDCQDCQKDTRFVCTSEPNTISQYKPRKERLPWIEASTDCENYNLHLPNKTNTFFLRILNAEPFWINDVRVLTNFPTNGNNDANIPLCFCGGNVKHIQCPTRLQTYCLPVPTREVYRENITTEDTVPLTAEHSTGITQETSRHAYVANMIFESRKAYTTDITATTEPLNAVRKTYFTSPELQMSTYKQDTNPPTVSVSIIRDNMSDSTRRATQVAPNSSTDGVTKEDGTTGVWSRVGGVSGGLAAIIIVSVVIVIIILKRHRMKRDNKTILNATTTNKPLAIVTHHKDLLYDTFFEEGIAPKKQNATLSQIPMPEDEQVIYAQAQKAKVNSANQMTHQYNITELNDANAKPVLYSMVKKTENTQANSPKLKECGGFCTEYDETSFINSENGESLENVYDKADFHLSEFHTEQTGNMYDKANFRFEVSEIDTGNEYDVATPARPKSSNYHTTYKINTTTDPTYDHLK